ncbi:hypothetical protein [Streptomyces sp. NPDC046985]|uniref:hypothetical protein n=1 Tax=Streptomyces sp. NPDC046985 TaxID=3155377 RepID=UPI0033E0114F
MPLLANALPALTDSLLGSAPLPPPPAELHISSPVDAQLGLANCLDTDVLGSRTGAGALRPASEYLPEDVVSRGDLAAAVAETLRDIALDWRYLHPELPMLEICMCVAPHQTNGAGDTDARGGGSPAVAHRPPPSDPRTGPGLQRDLDVLHVGGLHAQAARAGVVGAEAHPGEAVGGDLLELLPGGALGVDGGELAVVRVAGGRPGVGERVDDQARRGDALASSSGFAAG